MLQKKNIAAFCFVMLFFAVPRAFSQQVPVGEATIIIQGIGEFKITEVKFTNVSQDMVLSKESEFVVSATISGTGTGSFSYGWYLDGILKFSGSEQMTTGQSVTLSSPKDFIQTDLDGIQRSYYLKITVPNENQSETFTYKVESAPSSLFQIPLVSPESGDMSEYAFTWDEVSGAAQYKLWLAKDANLTNASSYITTGNTFKYPKNAPVFQHNETVYWQVKAYGQNEALLAQSKVESFVSKNEILFIEEELNALPKVEAACEEEKIIALLKKENKEKKEKIVNALPLFEKLKQKCGQNKIHPVTGTPVCDIVNKYVFVPDYATKIKEWDEELKKYKEEKAGCKDLESCIEEGGGE